MYAISFASILFLFDTISLKEIFNIYLFQFHKVIYFSVKDIDFLIQNFLSQGVHSFSILSDDRSKASSKTMPPYTAI